MNKKIIKYSGKIRGITKNKKDVVILVGGCFDIIHIGHLKFLQRAKRQGTILIIILESDEFIVKKKNRQPLHNQQQRAEILSSLAIVDYVIKIPYLSTHQQYYQLIRLIKPDVIAVTRGDLQIVNKRKQAKEIKAKLVQVTVQIKDRSTTKIIKMLGI